jgi:hypothetical protein
MNDVMTMAEIEAAFPSEWVLVGDPQLDQYNRVQSGTVLAHSKDRDEVYRKAFAFECKCFAYLYTGPIPAPGKAIIL